MITLHDPPEPHRTRKMKIKCPSCDASLMVDWPVTLKITKRYLCGSCGASVKVTGKLK